MPPTAESIASQLTHAIVAKNLSKKYRAHTSAFSRLREVLGRSVSSGGREFIALDQVSFEIEKGCTLGVIGANGAGKSTLLKILGGIVDPSSGELAVTGKVASIIELGTGFHPDFTGRENIFLNAAIVGMSDGEVRASYDQIARFSELGDYLEMPVKTYSSGMFVRLAFAVAISANPDILLVDEALAVGDAVFAHRCLARIREMRERGVTIVFVTHDTNTVVNLCDRAILLERGRITADGAPKDVVHLYLLNVAERLTALKEDGRASAFHQVGAREEVSGHTEKRFGSFQARITDISIEDPQNSSTEKFSAGTPVRFQMIVKFFTTVSDPVFGIMIRNRFGVEVFGTNTLLRKMNTGTVDRGKTVRVCFELPLHLGAGVYAASFAVHTAGGHFFDYRVDAKVFEVIGAEDTIGIASLPAFVGISEAEDAGADDEFLGHVYPDAPSRLEMNYAAGPYLSGDWYPPELGEGIAARWLGKEGQVVLKAPADAVLLKLSAKTFYPGVADNPILVLIEAEGQELGKCEFKSATLQQFEFSFPVKLRGKTCAIVLHADKAWVPSELDPRSADKRELSVVVQAIEILGDSFAGK